MRWSGTVCSLVLCLLASIAHAQETDAPKPSNTPSVEEEAAQRISIPAGALSAALQSIAREFDANVLVSAELLEGKYQHGIDGRFTLRSALETLLANKGLQSTEVSPGTFAVLAETKPVSEKALNEPHVIPYVQLPQKPLFSSADHSTDLDRLRREDVIIVTGTRRRGRTVFESLAPIDVISSVELRQTASEELLDGLAQSLPAFTAFRLPLNDGNIFNRPTALRGLSSDKTLVLVNGKRRHRSAFLETARGQPTDLSQIPISLIGRVEVLRDGASAQYGSDAIGGVINIILEEDTQTTGFAQYGEYYEGDGDTWRTGFRTGAALPNGGFSTFAFESFQSAPTSRSVQRDDAKAFQAAHPEISLPDPVQRWGQPEREGWRVGLNSEFPLTSELDGFLFGTFGLSQGISDFNWRNPDVSNAYTLTDAFPDFDLRSLYPAGFTPRFGQEETDVSLFAGLRSATADALQWEASLGYGGNHIDYILNNTINASLGPESPVNFRPGRLKQSELAINIDASRDIALPALRRPAHLAFGSEYRQDRYVVERGDPASYAVGPAAVDGAAIGANGFPGYSPDQEGWFDQVSFAAFADLELPLSDKLAAEAAVRYEDYSLFGDTFEGKLSARYALTSDFAVRGTVSTGFRAPTAGQVFSQRTSQGLDSTTLNGVTNGRFSPESLVADVISERDGIHIRSLRPERSLNIAAGVTFRTDDDFLLTLDVFQISIWDEFGRTPTYELEQHERDVLQAMSPDLGFISNVYFFQNTYDRVTRGVDLVASKNWQFETSDLEVTFAYSHANRTLEKSRFDPEFALDQLLVNPNLSDSMTMTATYHVGVLELYSRLRAHGDWRGASGIETDPIQVFGGRTFFDVALTWNIDPKTSVRVGAENVFDTYPDRALNQSNRGLLYSRDSPYDTDGGLFYLRLSKDF